MKRYFTAISEPKPDHKWKQLFLQRWPAYRAWINESIPTTDLPTALAALKKYMPEMVPNHERLCALVGADELASVFLTGFQPPTYFSACSQAVTTVGDISLIRNYDYHLDRFEGILLNTAWNGKKVIASSDCLIGVLDGMNEDGLAVSLTFGGRTKVGYGFGIPYILRYILEFCSTVKEGLEVLRNVPSHMSYNVTLADRSGEYRTAQIAPDRKTMISEFAFATNHQGKIDWEETVDIAKTRERANFLEALLKRGFSIEKLTRVFLTPPLYNTNFAEGFGTLYTAVYKPMEGQVELHWPNEQMSQSFDNFKEEIKIVTYERPINSAV
ncbi:C45 family autoproteolytic acyltransferase/hydolase [Algoriphagus chordae]|uniref:Putative choloylglycine hydrolase n=1 Tax=Algoriphagus chordae TaxID=237019 RepID=A0A2W7RHC9_9BACT|nr:C45 family peptidase [Algoriphagus chordae]PZX54967.1 putative choloylglycine hydrolase [Algoriphagus chordae]